MLRDYKGLPQKYWKRQNFCWYIHDIILSIFCDCMKNNKMNDTIKFNSNSESEKFDKVDDIIDWLYKNGYGYQADNIMGKRIFHAILADMMNFIYESLNTIEKGKITVSLALLRKPFRDNLLYLEWLLGNPKEFIHLVYKQEIDKYAIEHLNRNNNRKIESIIKNAMSQIGNKEFFNKMDDIIYYDLRYNYKSENSLQRVWNKANHLVTTGKNIRSNEFNFVFLDEDLHLDFIDYYYRQVPHLLFYTYNIILELYDRFIRKISDTTRVYNNFLIVYKFCDMIGKVKAEEYFNKELKSLIVFPCEYCKEMIKINLYSKEFDDFRYGWSFKCPNCGNEINICRYIFLEDYKNKDRNLKVVK